MILNQFVHIDKISNWELWDFGILSCYDFRKNDQNFRAFFGSRTSIDPSWWSFISTKHREMKLFSEFLKFTMKKNQELTFATKAGNQPKDASRADQGRFPGKIPYRPRFSHLYLRALFSWAKDYTM